MAELPQPPPKPWSTNTPQSGMEFSRFQPHSPIPAWGGGEGELQWPLGALILQHPRSVPHPWPCSCPSVPTLEGHGPPSPPLTHPGMAWTRPQRDLRTGNRAQLKEGGLKLPTQTGQCPVPNWNLQAQPSPRQSRKRLPRPARGQRPN